MPRTWLSIRVELIEGGGEIWWPRPGRIFAVTRQHRFSQLATAIDDAFARWDRAHLHLFELEPGRGGLLIDRYWDDPPEDARMDDTVRLGALTVGQQFVYVFDLGDHWAHLTLAEQRIDPEETLGIVPDRPLPYWGWGEIPDQYRRRWDGDDGESTMPSDPGTLDLPPLQPGWGS